MTETLTDTGHTPKRECKDGTNITEDAQTMATLQTMSIEEIQYECRTRRNTNKNEQHKERNLNAGTKGLPL